jgi:cytochrome P450
MIMSYQPLTFNLIPGPPAMPVLGWRGNLIRFGADPVGYIRWLHRTYGDLVAFIKDRPGWMFAFGPEYNHYLLTNPDLFYSKPFITAPPESALERLTSGLLSMNGDQHRQQRRLILPAFHKKRIEAYRDDMVTIAEQIVGGWRSGGRLDIAREMQKLTLRIASKTLFGLDAVRGADSLGGMIKRWLNLLDSMGLTLFPIDLPGMPYHRLLRLSERLEANVLEMIGRKRAQLADESDVMAMLIHARDEDGSRMSDAELIGQATVLFIAGHETSSNALTWTLFLLSQHPHALDDLCDELSGVLRGDAPTLEQLARLPLLERVIKESMRLLPPASVSLRVSTAPFELGPYQLPRGATVFFSQYLTHHMPGLYPEPEKFLPRRWETIDPSAYEYLPFGAGPRMCIGATFAMMEIKIALALILQRYRLALQPRARIDRRLRITLSPKYGLPMIVLSKDQPLPRHAPRGNIREMVDLE